MINYIAAAVLVLILGAAALYVYRSKKHGVKCIGCPSAGNCGKGSCDGCSCGGYKEH